MQNLRFPYISNHSFSHCFSDHKPLLWKDVGNPLNISISLVHNPVDIVDEFFLSLFARGCKDILPGVQDSGEKSQNLFSVRLFNVDNRLFSWI